MTLVSLVNVALCVIILVLGYMEYKKNQNKEVLYIGIAFGLFGVSHVLALLGLAGDLASVLVVIRMFAYLLVAFSMYKIAMKH